MTRKEFLSYPLGSEIHITTLISQQIKKMQQKGQLYEDIPSERTLLRRYKTLLSNCKDKFGFLCYDDTLSNKGLYIDKYYNYYLSKYLISELVIKGSPVYTMYRNKELSRDDKFKFVEKAEIFFNEENVKEELIPHMILELDFMVKRLSIHMNEICVKYVNRIQEACNNMANENTNNEFDAYIEGIMKMNKFTYDLRQMCEIAETQSTDKN